MYHPLPINIEVQRRQREEFQVAKFLSILDSEHVEVKHGILDRKKFPFHA